MRCPWSTNQVSVCVVEKLLMVRARGQAMDLDPTWGKYAVLQVVGVGFRYSPSSEGAKRASDNRDTPEGWVFVSLRKVTSMAMDWYPPWLVSIISLRSFCV